MLRSTLMLLLAGLALAAPARASDLALDGQTTAVTKTLGSTLTIDVTGNPGFPASVLIDLTPGPTSVNGVSFPIGFSPAWKIFPIGVVPAGGTLTTQTTLSSDPAFDGLVIYTGAVVFDPGATSGLDASNGVVLTLSDGGSVELAGNSLAGYPFFEHVTAFNEGETIEVGVEVSRFPALAGQTADVYVVDTKDLDGWMTDPTLTDVTGGAETFVFSPGSIASNRLTVDTGTLSGDAGTGLGVGYDVVIDVDQDGLLGPDDLIDGLSDRAGLYVVHDLTQPGPLPVTEVLYSGGSFLGQNTFYPTDIASMGQLPVIVVSHGNGHNYQWYDHIGFHMASYGYIVMSHENNTVPGIETASTTTLTNTDYFLGNLDTIAGGVLDGHVDDSRITWIGHSRGGEGVARAYDRLFDGTFVPANYTVGQITLVSSIAPTGFLAIQSSNPHNVEYYHVWTGGADADVNGCASSNVTQTQQIHDRAQQSRGSISLHGVGHGDFHNSFGSVASGPCLVGKDPTHAIMRGYFLPLVKYVIEGNVPAEDYLWRQWESFHPLGAPVANPCVVVDLQHKEGSSLQPYVLDDFQSGPAPTVSSSGGAVNLTVGNVTEGAPDDGNSNFTHNVSDAFNGFTYARTGDRSRALVFEYSVDSEISWSVPAAGADFSDFAYLSFRAAQATRHPLTTSTLGDTTFEVRLTDGGGTSSTIGIGAYGGGLEEPYQRTGCGTGAPGWHNEYETVRIRLTDFQNGASGLDLTDIASVTFLFGPSHGSPVGRLGMDDLQLTKD